LGCKEGETDVHPSESLEQDHAEAKTLERVQDTQPQPETAGYKGSACIAAGPREKQAHARNTPPDLSPTGRSEAAGEDWQDPTVGFRKVSEHNKNADPDEAEEKNDEKADVPRFGMD
jgi:hypothetical protein